MSAYKKIGLNTFYQVMGRFVTAAVGLVTTRLITSHFGLEGYGEYQTVIAFVTLFWVLTDFGFNAITVREMAANEEEVESYYSALITLRVALGCVVLGVAWVILAFLPYSQLVKTAVLIGSLTIFFQSLMGIGNAAFQLRLKYGYQLLSNTLGSIVSLVMFLIVISMNSGLVGLSIAFASASVVMGLTNLYLARRLIKFKLRLHDKLRYLLKETLPFGLVLLLSLLTTKIDAILLSILHQSMRSNESAVGIYNLSYKLFELVLIVPAFFMNSVYPTLIRHHEASGLSGLLKTSKKVIVALIVGSLAATFVLYVLAPFLVHLLADSANFNDSIKVLQILSLSLPLFFVSALMMWMLVILKRQRALIVIYGISLATNLLLNLAFIPAYSYWAAAVNTGVTELVIVVLSVVALLQHTKSK